MGVRWRIVPTHGGCPVSWGKIDDQAAHHRKIRGLPTGLAFAGFGLYVASIGFARREFTDGVILRTDLPALLPGHVVPLRLIASLVAVGLWDVLADGRSGWCVHDYLDWNESAAVRRQQLASDAGRKRLSRGNPAGCPDGVQADVQTESRRSPAGVQKPLREAQRSSEKRISEKLREEKLRDSDSVVSTPPSSKPTGPAPGLSRDQLGSDGRVDLATVAARERARRGLP